MGQRFTTAELDAMGVAPTTSKKRLTTAELDAMEPQKSEDDIRRESIQQAFDDSTGFQKFGIGVAKPFVEGYHGVRKMLGGEADPEAEARLKAVRGGAATAGELAGNVAAFALPGGAIARGLSAAPKAALLADATLSAVGSGTQSLGRGDSFAGGAAMGAAGSGIGAGLTKGLATVGRGFDKVSDPVKRLEVNKLLEAGVPLTPGQYANGPVRWVEDRLAAVPVIGDVVKKRQLESFAPWNREVLADIVDSVGDVNAAAGRKIVTEGGHEGFEQAGQFFSRQWDAFDQLKIGDTTGGSIRQTLRQLKDTELAAKRNGQPELVTATRAKINEVRSQLPKEVRERLDDLNASYADYLTAARTAKYKGPRSNEGVFTPGELLQAVSARSKGTAMATGDAPLQDVATKAAKVLPESRPGLGEQIANPLLGIGAIVATGGTAAIPLGAVAAPYASRTALKHLRGQTATAKTVKAIEEHLKRLGLKGSTLGGAAGATGE